MKFDILRLLEERHGEGMRASPGLARGNPKSEIRNKSEIRMIQRLWPAVSPLSRVMWSYGRCFRFGQFVL